MLDKLKKIDKGIEMVQLVTCCLIMFAIMWLTFFMVFFRYVLNNSIVWAEEILRYLMMWVVLVGAGLTTRVDEHVCMDGVQGALERWPKIRAAHYALTRIIVFVFMILLWAPAMDLINRTGGSTATSLPWLPKMLVYASFPAGIISICLSLLSQVPQKVYAIVTGTEHNAVAEEMQALAAEMNEQLEREAETAQLAEEKSEEGGNES